MSKWHCHRFINFCLALILNFQQSYKGEEITSLLSDRRDVWLNCHLKSHIKVVCRLFSVVNLKPGNQLCRRSCEDSEVFSLHSCKSVTVITLVSATCYCFSQTSSTLTWSWCITCLSCPFQVVFVKKIEAFSSLSYHRFHCEKKHDIYFSDEKIYAQYRY